MKKTVNDIDVNGQKVMLRADFNVPLKDGKVADDTRLRATLPTLKYLKEQGARIIVCSHLGRPKGEAVEDLRLNPVADRLADLLGSAVTKLDDSIGDQVTDVVLRPGPTRLPRG